MIVTITKKQARHFLLQKQLLYPPQSLEGPDVVEKVFSKLRLIQYDPLNPCGRNTDLVLQARIKGYHPGDYTKWLYTEKKGIECYDKELCIIPIEDFSLITHRQIHTNEHPFWKTFISTHQKDIEQVLRQLKESGPLTASDIDIKKIVEGNWTERSTFGRVALDILWRTGRAVISKREKGRKYYDLAEKVYGKPLSIGDKQLTKEHILRRINRVGMLRKAGTEEGWQGLRPTKMKTLLVEELIREGQLIEIEIKESGNHYVALATDQETLESTSHTLKDPKAIFLGPLDNLLWDRSIIHDLFGFFYRWEVYTPLSKRKFGYYVLPILFGDRIIGQIEPVFHLGKLEIKGIWREVKDEWGNKEKGAIHNAINNFKKYLNATEVIYPSTDLI